MSNGPDGVKKKSRSLARASKMNLRAPASLAGVLGNEKEANVFSSRFNKPDGTSLHQITDKTHVVTSAVLENRIDVTNGRAQTRFQRQQPRKQDEAYASSDSR